MTTLLAVGETMALVVPARAEPVQTAVDFRVEVGGAESNVAMHVAALGHEARWFSRLGDDELGRRVLTRIASVGVDVDGVILDSARPTGLYVKSPGIGVVYYRRGSAASALSRPDADALPLDEVDILHVTGITAALSPDAADFLDGLMESARRAGVLISFDVNHRPKLWAGGADIALLGLARAADFVFVGRDEAARLWGAATPSAIRELLHATPELIVKDDAVGATVFTADDTVFEPALRVEVVETVGAGDAFAGGYLSSRMSGGTLSERLRAGHSRAALTLSTTSDFPGWEL